MPRNEPYHPKRHGEPIKCIECGYSGGTLVKVEGGYKHQDTRKCALLKMARRGNDGRSISKSMPEL